MKFVWIPNINRFRRTETEAKKEKLAYEVVEFETDGPDLVLMPGWISHCEACWQEPVIARFLERLASGAAQPVTRQLAFASLITVDGSSAVAVRTRSISICARVRESTAGGMRSRIAFG